VTDQPSGELPELSASWLGAEQRLPATTALPERVLQFGEGNFLRAFVDWMLERMNAQGLFGGLAVLVQPIASGMSAAINRQDGLYTVILRGLAGGQTTDTREIVGSVSRCIDPYADCDAFLRCAENPELRFIVSNTTEAGIRTDPEDRLDARPARSFPGKLTQLLYARFRHFNGAPERGLVLLPCELIERNGAALERAVLDTAAAWQLEPAFTAWLTQACVFTSTLVDRIVTGYPKDEVEPLTRELGYRDSLLVAGELFHSWVIESPRPLEQELPLNRAGLNVIWTNDLAPYRERKVRVLNGAHTMLVLAAYLAGKDTVRECMQDPLLRRYVERGIHDEILPTLQLPKDDRESFADSVVERFDNPFIRHYLISIALNSVSKYKARILGTVFDYTRLRGEPPPLLSFALAALIAFYRGREIEDGALIGTRNGVPYRIQDDPGVLAFFRQAWAEADVPITPAFCSGLVAQVLGQSDFWGQDLRGALPGLEQRVARELHAICTDGPRRTIERLI
jgi:tagaturonate reductase